MQNLKYFISHGNTTVYEWRTGIVPKTIEKGPVRYDFGEDESVPGDVVEDAEINFDVNDVVLDEVF